MAQFTVDEAVQKYMKLRAKKSELEGTVKEQVADLKEQMSMIEAWIKQQADTLGVTSFKTEHGTAYVTKTDFANVADWDAILDYIKANDAYHLLERRVNKAAVREIIDDTGDIIPGVNFASKLGVNIRKS